MSVLIWVPIVQTYESVPERFLIKNEFKKVLVSIQRVKTWSSHAHEIKSL